MCIVALTDQFVHQRIHDDKYKAYVGQLELEVCPCLHAAPYIVAVMLYPQPCILSIAPS